VLICPLISVRRNLIPLFAGAGRITMRTNLPECNPIPSKKTLLQTVVWNGCSTNKLLDIVFDITQLQFSQLFGIFLAMNTIHYLYLFSKKYGPTSGNTR
jgi:hypothetical protein